MKLVVTNDLKNNIYTVQIDIVDIQPEDTEIFSDYGSQKVDISATINKTVIEEVDDGLGGTTPTPKEVTLINEGSIYKYLPTEFPIIKSFATSQYGLDTEFVAIQYGKLLESRIKTIIDGLKAKKDNFSSVREVIL